MFALKKIRYPKQVEPPDGIGHELGRREGPSLTKAKQGGPFYSDEGFWRVAADICEFFLADARMLFRLSIKSQPET